MPLYLEKNNGDGSRLAIWQMTESVAELFALAGASDKMKEEVGKLRSETRKKEWLTVRILLRNILNAHAGEIVYDEKGKPHLTNGNGHISFSHTRNFAAIIFHPTKNVGIDIETIHERIEKISHKFVNAEESAFINNEKRIETLHVIWGVKEVLFKIHGRGGVDFRKHLQVYPFNLMTEGTVDAEMRIESASSLLRINYFFKDRLVVAYGCQ